MGAIVLSSAAPAGQSQGATIVGIAIYSSANVAYIQINQAISGSPSCSAVSTSFAFPLGTSLANQILALLIAARAGGTPVTTLAGNGACDTVNGYETLLEVNL